MEQKGKRTHDHGYQSGDCAGGRGQGEVEEGIRVINGNGENTMKNNQLKNFFKRKLECSINNMFLIFPIKCYSFKDFYSNSYSPLNYLCQI